MAEARSILVVGADSFIGRHLLADFDRLGIPSAGTSRRKKNLIHLDLDGWPGSGTPAPGEPQFGQYCAAIIAAAVSKVELCARDPAAAERVNVTGTLTLIDSLLRQNILPVFLSSEYVFDGTANRPYEDDDPLCPNTVYGQHKARVEEALRSAGKPYLVLRLSKIYSLEPGDGSLLDEIAARLRAGQTYSAAFDQVFSPTFVGDLAPIVVQLLSKNLRGLFNVCAPEPWTRYDLACAVARKLGLPLHLIRKISLDELSGSVKRPKNTSMRPARLEGECSVTFTKLEQALQVLR